MNPTDAQHFRALVWEYYQAHGRHDLPWRRPRSDGVFDPYHITISEIMLQQTQVARVVPKYEAFLAAFPTIQTLAAAPLAEVLLLWSGLGYNRRAKFLWQLAQVVVAEYDGVMPATQEALVRLPGVGPNTAGAILAYAHNQPAPFIETNIRTVYIHHFFYQDNVSDGVLMPVITATLPNDRAREWHWALMDYGTHLKQTAGNAARRSKTYTKQSAFEGSRRQLRGRVLRLLSEGMARIDQLQKTLEDERLGSVLTDLEQEGFITQIDGWYQLRA